MRAISHRYDAVVFDFDGTLADSGRAIFTTVDAVLGAVGLPAADQASVRAAIGLPLAEMFRAATCDRVSDAQVTGLVAAYRERFGLVAARQVHLFPGIHDQLDRLTAVGVWLGIATSKSSRGVRELLDLLGLAGHFAVVVADDMVDHPKPHPEMLRRVIKDLDVDPAATVMVGDTEFDMLMGKAAGVRTCAVSWGHHPRARLVEAAPDHIVDSPYELVATLESSPCHR